MEAKYFNQSSFSVNVRGETKSGQMPKSLTKQKHTNCYDIVEFFRTVEFEAPHVVFCSCFEERRGTAPPQHR